MIEPLKAFYSRNRVYIPLTNALMELRERGFGDLKGKRLFLSPYEVFYLVEKGRINVIDQEGSREMGIRDLVNGLSYGKAEVWIKYLIYRDLRDRGYIVREASKVDFEVHGKGALRRLITIIYEGAESNLERLQKLLTMATTQKKELILAVIDRRTDIVYYSLNSLRI